MVNHPGGQAQYQTARLEKCHGLLQPPVRRRHGSHHHGGRRQGGLYGGTHVVAEDNGLAHIHRQSDAGAAARHRHKALQPQQIPRPGIRKALQGHINGIGVLAAQGQSQHLRQKQLTQLILLGGLRHKKAAYQQRPPAGVLPHKGRQLCAPQPGEQVL